MSAATQSIYTTLIINGALCALSMLVFELIRLHHVDIFAPRARFDLTGPCSLVPSRNWFGWVRQLQLMSDDDMLRYAGMDGYVFLRYLQMCTYICCWCTPGAVVLLTIYYTSDGYSAVQGFSMLTMANIAAGNDRLWVSVAFIYIFTLIFLYFIYKEYENFVRMREKHLAAVSSMHQSTTTTSTDPSSVATTSKDGSIPSLLNPPSHHLLHLNPLQTKFTVIVDNIPKQFRSSERLRELFESIFPGEVMFAYCAVLMEPLESALIERCNILHQLESAFAEFAAYPESGRPKLWLRERQPVALIHRFLSMICCSYSCSCWLTKCLRLEQEDALNYWSKRLTDVTVQIRVLQGQAQAATHDPVTADHRNPKDNNSMAGSKSISNSRSTGECVSGSGSGNDYSNRELKLSKDASVLPTAEVYSELSEKATSEVKGQSYGSIESAALTLRDLKSSDLAAIFQSGVADFWDGVLDYGCSMIDLYDSMLEAKDKFSAKYSAATGFVTFKTRKTQLSATHVPMLSRRCPHLTAAAAPCPNDIIWSNVAVTSTQIKAASYVTALFYFGGLLAWSAVLTFIAALSSLQKLEKYLPFLSDVNPIAYSVLQGVLPVHVMILFTYLIANIMTYISVNIERRKTESSVQMRIFRYFYLYNIYNVYWMLVTGSVWQSLVLFLNEPRALIRSIGIALPSVSVFFVNLIVTLWLGVGSVTMLRPYTCCYLYVYHICYRPMHITRNMMKNGPLKDFDLPMGILLPGTIYVLVVLMIYWVIAPVVVLLCVGYFYSMYIIYKYLYTFVFVRTFESGGRFWYALYYNSMAALLATVMCGMVYMAVKEGGGQVLAMIPLPFIVSFAWRRTERSFKLMSQSLSYESATQEDLNGVFDFCGEHGDDVLKDSTVQFDASNRFMSHEELLNTFSADFIKQPSVKQSALTKPYPHRIGGYPLFVDLGTLHDVYHEERNDSISADDKSI